MVSGVGVLEYGLTGERSRRDSAWRRRRRASGLVEQVLVAAAPVGEAHVGEDQILQIHSLSLASSGFRVQ